MSVIDQPGLHVLATCQIHYRGFRIIAQSIIPGIISNQDQSSLTEYGSVDHGEIIHHTPEFHEAMKKIAAELTLTTVTLKDGKDKEFEVCGSTDWKGIRGTDKRSYLLDLIRVTPRDSNFPDEEHASWVVRHELMMIYQKTKSLEFAKSKMEGEPTEAPTELTQPAEDAKEEEKKEYQ